MNKSGNECNLKAIVAIRFSAVIVFGFFFCAFISSGFAVCDTLTGKIVDSATGRPLTSVTIVLVERKATTVTGSDGRFSFKNIDAGTDTLICALIDYERLRVPVAIPGTVSVQMVSNPVELETIEVTGIRPDEVPPHERTSSSVNVISAEDIPDRAATVDEVLDSQVGVDIRSMGGVGASSEISIRGSTTQQVAVYVDGIPMNASGSGINALSLVPMNQVQKIEVYRGASPGSFGAGAIGGIVDITTITTAEGFDMAASTSYGSYSTMHQSISSRFGKGNNRFALSLGRNTSKNDFRYFDNRGTTIVTTDDGWETRENSDYSSLGMLAKWDSKIADGHEISSKISYTDSERGVSGLGRRPATAARLSQSGLMVQSQYRFRERFKVLGWTARTNRAFYDPDDEAGRRGRQDTDDDISIWGLRSEFDKVTGPVLTHYSLEYSQEKYTASDAYDSSIVPPSRRHSIGLGMDPEIMLRDGKLWIVPLVNVKIVHDKINPSGLMLAGSATDSTTKVGRTVYTTSLGVRYHATSKITVRGNGGIYSRVPEFDELFGDTGDVVGNTALETETSRNADIGLHYESDSGYLNLDMTVFYRFAEDLIQRRNYGDYIISENIGKAEIMGIETWIGGSLSERRLSYHLSTAVQDARNRSDETVFRKERYYNKYLPYHPSVKSAATISFRVTDRLKSKWMTDYESSCYKGPSNLDEEMLEERFIHTLEFDYNITDSVQGVFAIVNITDDHAPDRWGYPKPGRGFYGTVKWNYSRADQKR